MIIVLNDSLVHSCLGVAFRLLKKLKALEVLMGFFEYFSPDLAKLLCSCLSLIDAISELYDMDKKIFNEILIRK